MALKSRQILEISPFLERTQSSGRLLGLRQDSPVPCPRHRHRRAWGEGRLPRIVRNNVRHEFHACIIYLINKNSHELQKLSDLFLTPPVTRSDLGPSARRKRSGEIVWWFPGWVSMTVITNRSSVCHFSSTSQKILTGCLCMLKIP